MPDEERKEVTQEETTGPTPISDDIAGVDQKLVEAWKDKYTTIFATYHLGIAYVYRAFNYREFREMKDLLRQKFEQTKKAITTEEEMDEILKRCLLHPSKFAEELETGDLPGGLPSVLYESIMQASGFAELYPDIITKTT